MNSLDTIRAAARNLAARAWAEGREPFLVEHEDIEDWLDALAVGQIPVFPFRLVGEHVPVGWEVTDRTLVVNENGHGGGGGFALELNAMVSALRAGSGYALLQARDAPLATLNMLSHFCQRQDAIRRHRVPRPVPLQGPW